MYRRHIVLVEDDALMRSLLADYLEQAGFLVTTAGTAADARRALKSVDPDAAVLDIDLGPGPTGLDIGEALLAESNDIAVVYLTSITDVRALGGPHRKANSRAAYLHKNEITEAQVLVDALDAVLLERGLEGFRHDDATGTVIAELSTTQIQVLRMIAQGKTNRQIADERGRSLTATEAVIARAMSALGIDPGDPRNSRVLAAQKFLIESGLNTVHD